LTLKGPAGAVLVNGLSSTEEALGFYYYDYTTVADIYGGVHGLFVTADATVDQKQMPALIDAEYALTAAKVGYIDASINGVPAAVWLASGRDLSTSPPSAATIASAVWAAVSRTLTSMDAGVIATIASSVATAVFNVAYATLTAAGSIGQFFVTKLGLLGGATVPVSRPINASGELEIVIGDSYAAADGRQFTWIEPTSGSWPVLTGAAIVVNFGGTNYTGSVVAGATYPKSVQVELTAVQTALIAEGVYHYSVKATLSGSSHVLTLARDSAEAVTR
jgi:hypothetical protein